jgi:hypothetical protein
VERAREITIGRIPANLTATLNANDVATLVTARRFVSSGTLRILTMRRALR